MFSRQLQILLQRSKTTSHLLQVHPLVLKTAVGHSQDFICHYIISACSVSVELARLIFESSSISPPLFAWNTIIKAYSKSSTPIEAIKLFFQLQWVGLRPDNFTYPFVIKACGQCLLLREGMIVHSMIFKTGLSSDRYIGNTFLRMYTACNAILFARNVFDEMTDRDVVSWSSMIAGYVACNSPKDALVVFRQMKLANEKPNSITLISLLSACTLLLDINTGEAIHTYVIMNNIELDVALGTALLEMYSKCGYIDKALYIFNSMREKNLQSRTVMISRLAAHGRAEDAISIFTQMEQTGLKPDSISFSSILCACSHLGLVNEGRKYFHSMVEVYNIRPTMEHYGCVVDMLGRAGMLEEAYEIVKNMPMKPNSIILRSFLSACSNCGEYVFIDEDFRKVLLELEPELGANYVLTAGLSSVSGCWSDASELRVAMKDKGLKKVVGCSWVDLTSVPSHDIYKEEVG